MTQVPHALGVYPHYKDLKKTIHSSLFNITDNYNNVIINENTVNFYILGFIC